MPVYEFYCPDCHTIFSFFSRSPAPQKQPDCPQCGRRKLEREVSAFAVAKQGGDTADELPMSEAAMERAMASLADDAAQVNEDNPKAAAVLMRKFEKAAGLKFGDGMDEALARMESGEDVESIEADMGDAIEAEDPFTTAGGRRAGDAKRRRSRGAPRRDDTWYDL